MKEHVWSPTYAKGELVRTSLFDQKGRPKNDAARKCLSYYAQVGVVAGWFHYSVKGLTDFVYKVRMDDGKILQLTGDCLMPVGGSG